MPLRATVRGPRPLLCIVAVVVASGCARVGRFTQLATSPLDPAEARAIYQRACASCHGPEGRGDGPEAPRQWVVPPDLTHLRARHGGTFPAEYVREVVSGEREVTAHGTRDMPVWRERFGSGGGGAPAAASFYAARRLEALVTFLESVQDGR
jgi:mono/diheme cytochrome c family protein